MKILVTGGAGYIGSHVSRLLEDSNFELVVLDSLYSGYSWAVADKAQFVEGDVGDTSLLDKLFSEHRFDGVIHFAAHIEVEESVNNPLKYYTNNSAKTMGLVNACVKHKVNSFVFSSTAAVYGNPLEEKVTEQTPLNPINPYGRSKLISEWTLRDTSLAHPDLNYVALRYFNVAGAHSSGKIGQATPRATHLIKVACEAALGRREMLKIFGTDYDTHDGTCIRDYIHVEDLAQAHVKALDYLKAGHKSDIFNCGYGHGYSVKEVIDVIKKVTGTDFIVENTERREGDPARLIADNKKIKEVLGWEPKYDDLELICKSAYDWEKHWQKELAKHN